ncbi:hypothetical protein JCM5350_007644 [Sporobolomyces pararoseus]
MTSTAARAGLSKRSAGVRRLLQEATELSNDDSPDYNAAPLESDLFDWHFTIRGLSGTEFEGGIYHGRMILPSEYPFKPPEIYLLTPSGRFEVNRKICLSISNFHPETWQPSWGVRTALLALIAFFESDPKGAVGSLKAPPEERKRLANASQHFKCSTCGYDAADHESFSALPEPAPASSELEFTPKKSESDLQEPEEPNEDESEVVPETEEASEVNSRSSTPSPGDDLLSADSSSIPPTTIYPATPSAPRNYPSSTSRVPSSVPDSNPPVGPSSRPPHQYQQPPPNLYLSGSSPVPPTVATPQDAITNSPSRTSSTSTSTAPVEQQQPPSPTRTSHNHARLDFPPPELIDGGPPSYIDRAILATLLAIVALIVRKVA